MKTFFVTKTGNYLLYEPELHVLLDVLRLFDLFTVCGITLSDNQTILTTKTIMSIATSIAKAGFSPRRTPAAQMGGGYGIISTYYSDTALTRILDNHGITFSSDKTTYTIGEETKLLKLRIHFIMETIKHKIYEHSDHEPSPPEIKTLDTLINSINSQLVPREEIVKFLSEIDTIISENANYDSAEVIAELNRLQQETIKDAIIDAPLPNLSVMNLNVQNRKRFRSQKTFKSTRKQPKLRNSKRTRPSSEGMFPRSKRTLLPAVLIGGRKTRKR